MRSFLTQLQREARLQSVRRRADQKMRKMRCRGFNLRRVGDSAGRRIYLDHPSPGEGVFDRAARVTVLSRKRVFQMHKP